MLDDTGKPNPRPARLAVATAFGLNGIAFGNWFVRIPAVQENLDLSASNLGVALLGLPGGAVVAMPFAGWLVSRYGSRPVLWGATIAVAALIAAPGLAPSLLTLTAALFVLGAATGAMDVSMNAQGVAVERRYRRPIMSSFHAAFSACAMAGAVAGGVIASRGVGVEEHLVGVAAFCLPIAVGFGFWLLPAGTDIVARRPGVRQMPHIPRPLLALGIVGFCGLLAEGAMADWSAVFLRQEIGAGPGLAAAGFAIFSATMTMGRFSGDWIINRFGALLIIRAGSVVSAAGLGLAVIVDHAYTVLAGFALVGIGLSVVVPIVFSAAARMRGVASGPAIAVVTTTGYLGFMVGPPAIGFLADLISLRGAFGMVVALILLMAVLSGTVRAAADLGAPDG
jgi:MFS family permease